MVGNYLEVNLHNSLLKVVQVLVHVGEATRKAWEILGQLGCASAATRDACLGMDTNTLKCSSSVVHASAFESQLNWEPVSLKSNSLQS